MFDMSRLADRLGLETSPEDTRLLEGYRDRAPISLELKQTAIKLEGGYVLYWEAKVKVQTTYRLALGPTFKLLREGTFRSWLSRYGYQDIELGDESLDFKMTIKGDPEDWVKATLLPQARLLGRIHQHHRGRLPYSDGETITAMAEISTEKPDNFGLAALRRLPGAVVSPDYVPVQVSLFEPTRVDFLPTRALSGFATHVRSPNVPSFAPGSCSCANVAEVEALTRTANLTASLKSCSEAEFVIDGEYLWICWPTVMEDEEPLLSAARLLTRLSTPTSKGAYR
jgi:hypothetical protein